MSDEYEVHLDDAALRAALLAARQAANAGVHDDYIVADAIRVYLIAIRESKDVARKHIADNG